MRNKNDLKNIALIGAGAWGKNHLKNLSQMGVLHSVSEPSESTTDARKKDFPEVLFFDDYRDMLNNPDVTAVVIAVPASLHYEITRECLLAGKDVLVEKPLALTARRGEELMRMAVERDRILMVGHILQYHPAVLKLKTLIDSKELGDIRYIYSNRLNIGKLRTEENVLWSFAPHDISLIIMLMNGEEPVHVRAHGGAYINPDIFDTTLTSLEFNSGVKAHVFVSWLHPFKEQKLVVVGSQQMAVFDDMNDDKLCLYPHKIAMVDGNIPVAHKADSRSVEVDAAEPLRQELIHFVKCVKNRVQPRTDGWEGIKVLQVLEKAEESLRSGGSEDNGVRTN